MSQSSNHLRLFSWTWQWVHFTQMASTVTRSQSNRAFLGCGGTEDSHHGCAADKSAATAWCYHVNMDQNLGRMFPTQLNLCHEEFRQLWGQKGVQPGTSKVYLIKWTVSVYIHAINVIVNSYWCCWQINMTYFLGGKAMAMFIRLFNLLFFYKVILLSVPIHFHWMNKNSFEILPVTSTFVFHTRRQS